MTSSYELGKSALALFRSRWGDESLKNQCIRFDGWYWQEAYQGNERIREYPSATAAADASPMYTRDVNDPTAQPGDLWYFHFAGLGNAGHVGTVLGHDTDGRVLITHTSSSGDAVEQWSNNVRISHADTIPHRFRGGSHHYGSNAKRAELTAWPTGTSTPSIGEEEDEDMNVGMFKKVGATYHVIIGNLVSGFKLKYTVGTSQYNNLKAAQFKTGAFTEEDQSVLDRFEQALDAVRQGQ